jgi:hypothetical protein
MTKGRKRREEETNEGEEKGRTMAKGRNKGRQNQMMEERKNEGNEEDMEKRRTEERN